MSDTILYNSTIDSREAFRKSSPFITLVTYDTLTHELGCFSWDAVAEFWMVHWRVFHNGQCIEYHRPLHTIPDPDEAVVIVYAEHMNGSHS